LFSLDNAGTSPVESKRSPHCRRYFGGEIQFPSFPFPRRAGNWETGWATKIDGQYSRYARTAPWNRHGHLGLKTARLSIACAIGVAIRVVDEHSPCRNVVGLVAATAISTAGGNITETEDIIARDLSSAEYTRLTVMPPRCVILLDSYDQYGNWQYYLVALLRLTETTNVCPVGSSRGEPSRKRKPEC
jgi:hypothetical protein